MATVRRDSGGRNTMWWWAIAPLAALALLGPSLLGARTLAGGDHLVFWYPLMEFFQTHYRTDGVIPFWIPNIFAGMPLPESLGPSFFYPTDLLCWWVGVPVRLFYAWDAFLHLVVAAIGMQLLLRRLGVGVQAGAFAACAYVFSGYLQVQLATGTQVFVRAAAWIPWVFVVVEALVEAFAWWRAVPLGILMAFLVLTQAFQALLYGLLMVPLYLVAKSGPRLRFPALGRIAAAGGAAMLVAAALAAVVWLPAQAYYRVSFRHLASGVWAQMEFLRWSELATLIIPDVLGDGARAKYLGLIPVIFAAGAFVTTRRRAAPWAIVAGCALLFALGPQTFPGAWLGHLPLFHSFRVSSHWMVFVQLAICILAGLGFESAGGFALVRRWLPGWVLPAGCILLTIADAQRLARPHPRQLNAAEMGANPGMASTLNLLTRTAHEPFRIHSEEPHVLLNTRVANGLEWTTGYHGALLELYGRFFDAATACGHVAEAMAVLGATYSVRKALTETDGLVPLRQFVGQDGTLWWLCRSDRSVGRVFVPREVRADPDGTIALRMLCAGRLATEEVAWVQTEHRDLPRRGATGARVRWVGGTPNTVEAEAELRTRSLVVFSEITYPAWKGFIDGRRTPVLRADYLLRAVEVPAGRHAIRLVYDSLWFKVGLWMSILGWTALGLVGALGRSATHPGYTVSSP